FVPSERLPGQVVKSLYSRPYSKLPKRVREESGVLIPSEGVLRPCGRGDFYSGFSVNGDYDGGACRGVRERRQA
ncbi:MAG: hypothetical protein AABW87_01360, partial [Nanoarchaeota archaeon]